MIGQRFEAIPTVCSAAEVARAFVVAFWRLFDVAPSNATVRLMLAQWAIETSRGRSMRSFNVGNIKATEKWEGGWQAFKCNELLAPVRALELLAKAGPREDDPSLLDVELGGMIATERIVWFYPPHPASVFRAFPNINDGATDYVSTIYDRWPKAWEALLIGDPDRFVDALKAGKYFTAPIGPYKASEVSLFREFASLEIDLSYPEREGIDVAAATAASSSLLRNLTWEQIEADGRDK